MALVYLRMLENDRIKNNFIINTKILNLFLNFRA